jgi:hypothetical protein
MRTLVHVLVLGVVSGTQVTAETSIPCPAPTDQSVTVVCLSESGVVVHSANVTSAQAALDLADKRPVPRPSQ